MKTPTYDIHLVCGCPGAGKSTYSERLTTEINGVCFAIDEWVKNLHIADKPDLDGFDWYVERARRSGLQMRLTAQQIIERRVPAVFDNGFLTKKDRDIFVTWALEHGFSIQLHYIDVAREIRWDRVERRNSAQKDTFQFQVPRPIFDRIGAIFEAPNNEEMHQLNGVRITD